MGTALIGLGGLCGLVSFVCMIVIIIDAFRNEVWKGLVAFFCSLYALYYAFAEYQGGNKVMVIVGWLVGAAAAGSLASLGASMMALKASSP